MRYKKCVRGVCLTASLETRSSSGDGELAQIVSRALGETLLEFFYELVRHALNARRDRGKDGANRVGFDSRHTVRRTGKLREYSVQGLNRAARRTSRELDERPQQRQILLVVKREYDGILVLRRDDGQKNRRIQSRDQRQRRKRCQRREWRRASKQLPRLCGAFLLRLSAARTASSTTRSCK